MSRINGTFFSLHPGGIAESPYYNPLEYTKEICLSEHFYGGRPDRRDSYEIRDRSALKDLIYESTSENNLFLNESNCAHHLSYFLAHKHLNKTPAIVVNFDQHEDNGLPTGRFFCGSWGGNIHAYGNCDYLVVGVPYRSNYTVRLYDDIEDLAHFRTIDILSLHELLDLYTEIYVTVDMDILENYGNVSRTNWGPGIMSPYILTTLLNQALPQGKVVAADITGFPPKPLQESAEIKQYINDIEDVSKILLGKM